MFDDFIEMAQGGFQFVKAAFVEELHVSGANSRAEGLAR
jgi:hypothetical protein